MGEVTFRIDGSLFDDRYRTPRELYGDLDRVVRPDLHYHYSTPICAQRWLDVCTDPAYGHEALLTQVTAVLPGLVDAIAADRGGRDPVRVTSLGPGDGSIDEKVLRVLDRSVGVVAYRGLDFSYELLRRAVNRILSGDGFHSPFPIEAVCGDFTDLGSAGETPPPVDDNPHLFLLTGLTLGNYAEDALLHSLTRGVIRPGDYLLVDARAHGLADPEVEPSNGSLTTSYDLETVRSFVLGPIEVATHASSAHIEVGFAASRSLTVVPGAWNVVIHAKDLDVRMRLTGARVVRERMDLAVTTLYDPDQLASWFPSVGFHVVWREAQNGTSFFLLRHAGTT